MGATKTSKTKKGPAGEHQGTRFVEIEAIEASPDNPRRIHEGDARFQELVASIREIGLQQAIVVRPMDGGANGVRYRIVAGERRWRACRAAGMTRIEAAVRELTDEQAFLVTISENMHREDVHPLEEAAAIAKFAARGWTNEQIAVQLGKSPRWVARRSALTRLSSAIVEAATLEESPLSRWPVANLEMIAPFPEEVQGAVLEEFGEDDQYLPTAEDLRHWLGHRMQNLRSAPWDLADEELALGCGSCLACVKRTGVQPELFDDEQPNEGTKHPVSRTDRCLDEACWDEKLATHLAQERERLEAKHGAPVLALREGYGKTAQGFEDAVESYRFRSAKKSEPGAVPALVVNGPAAGAVRYVIPEMPVAGTGRGSSGGPTPLAERRAQLDVRRFKAAVTAMREAIEERLERGEDGAVEFLPPDWTLADAARIALLLGVQGNYAADHAQVGNWSNRTGVVFRGTPERYEAVATCSEREVAVWLVIAAAPVAVSRLRQAETYGEVKSEAEIERLAGVLRLDWQWYRAQAAEAHPEPKAWAGLRADGTPKGAKGKK